MQVEYFDSLEPQLDNKSIFACSVPKNILFLNQSLCRLNCLIMKMVNELETLKYTSVIIESTRGAGVMEKVSVHPSMHEALKQLDLTFRLPVI